MKIKPNMPIVLTPTTDGTRRLAYRYGRNAVVLKRSLFDPDSWVITFPDTALKFMVHKNQFQQTQRISQVTLRARINAAIKA